MTTVTEDLELPSGIDPTGVVVTVYLAGSGGDALPEGYNQTTGKTIVGKHRLNPAADGTWQLDLDANADLLPAGTVWARTVSVAQPGGSPYATVPVAGGPYRWDQILSDAPGTLETPALSAAVDTINAEQLLVSAGAKVDQSVANTEYERWLQLIRDTPIGTSPNQVLFKGGDVADVAYSSSGDDALWVLSDYAFNGTVDANDEYSAAPFAVLRNGLIIEDTAGGGFTSSLNTGTTGSWLLSTDHDVPGLWWPLTIFKIGSLFWVGMWNNDAVIDPPANPFGQYLDTHFVQLNVFAGYNTHFECGFTDKKFFIQCGRVSGSFAYLLGAEFNPPIDDTPSGEVGYAHSLDLDVTKQQLGITSRLARAPTASFSDVGTWEFWDGTTWSSDRSTAVELTDTNGDLINGSAGFAEVKPGLWMMAVHHMTDSHIKTFSAPAPEGPWLPVSRVPIDPPVGVPIGDKFTLGWHIKVLDPAAVPHLSIPAEHSLALMTVWPRGAIEVGDNIRRQTPMFRIIPWY